MTRLTWGRPSPAYEVGIDRGVFYPANGSAEPWVGLTSVQESPSDANESARYQNGVRTRSSVSPGSFSGHIEAFTYPRGFESAVLYPPRPKPFGLSYRSKGNDTYKIHLVYNVLLGPTGHIYDQEDPTPFGWDFTTKPVGVPGFRPTAHLVVETSIAYSWTVEALEDVLYGSADVPATLPSPQGVLDIFEENSILQIIDHGDGTWTAIGPDDVITMLDATTFQIDYPTAVYISPDTYTIHSL